MKTIKLISILFLFTGGISFAQYAPELDVRGTDDTADGGELQLATPTGTNFLRFFSGRLGDPSPHLYYSNQDTFHIATGGPNFSNFSKKLTILPNGFIGMNTSDPKSLLHVNGDFTTPWNVTFRHFQDGWTDNYQTYLNKSWNGDLWDYLYLGGTGNRDNSEQAAMILSHKQGILFGTGHNDGNQLTVEQVRIDTSGAMLINELSGQGNRPLYADSNGLIKAGEQMHSINLSGTSFEPSSVNSSTTWVSHVAGAYFTTAPTDLRCMMANLSLPQGSRIKQVDMRYRDTDDKNDFDFYIEKHIHVSGVDTRISLGSTILTQNNGHKVSLVDVDILNNFESYAISGCPQIAGTMDEDFKIFAVIVYYEVIR